MNLLLLIVALQVSQPAPDRLPFTDTCGNDPSFVEYRTRLSMAIERKDVAALRPLVADDVRNSLGYVDSHGWSAFVRTWELDQPPDSELWSELAEVLSLGCEEVGDQRIAPGNFTKTGEYNEPLVYVAVNEGAALRSRPDDAAPVVMALDSHVLIDAGEVGPEGWLKVRLTNGRPGYVRATDARSAIDYRAGFEKRDGRWIMTIFLAGD